MAIGPDKVAINELIREHGFKVVNQIKHLGFIIDKEVANLSKNWDEKIRKFTNLKNMLFTFIPFIPIMLHRFDY